MWAVTEFRRIWIYLNFVLTSLVEIPANILVIHYCNRYWDIWVIMKSTFEDSTGCTWSNFEAVSHRTPASGGRSSACLYEIYLLESRTFFFFFFFCFFVFIDSGSLLFCFLMFLAGSYPAADQNSFSCAWQRCREHGTGKEDRNTGHETRGRGHGEQGTGHGLWCTAGILSGHSFIHTLH